MHQLRFMMLAAAVLVLPACDRAGSPDDATTAPASPAAPVAASSPGDGMPRIQFARSVHDFGVITDVQDYYTTFEFTNTGTGTLVISDVKATCGCTVPTLVKTEYAPGESATLNVRFDPGGKAGPQNKTISVVSNTQPDDVAKLSIRADVRPLVHFEFFVRFGDLELGRQHTRRATLSYSDPNLEFTDVFVTNPYVTAKVIDAGKANPAAGGLPYLATMEVTIGSDAPWGLLRQTQVKFTARGRAAEQFTQAAVPYSMWVNAQLYGDVRADPIAMTSPETLGRGQAFKLSSRLSRTSGAPFQVTDIRVTETTTPGMKPYVVAEDPGLYSIYLEGTTPDSGGVVKGDVTVTTDVPGEESLTIQFAMFVK